MLLCELLQLLYYFYFFSSLCHFDPIYNIVIYFLLVLNFATVICVLSVNVEKNIYRWIPMKNQDFSSDESLVFSDDTIFTFHMRRYDGCHD